MAKAMKPIMFFDGGCPLCRREVAHYRLVDQGERVRWVDIAREPETLGDYGIDRSVAMRRLHVVDEQGEVMSGVPVFVAVWRQLPGYRHLAWVVVQTGLVSALERLYVQFASWCYRRRCGDAICESRRG